MGLSVGIDFGTATSSAAIFREGRAQLVPCREGGVVVPSLVAFDHEGSVLVGEPAHPFAEVDAGRVVFGAKRFLGRKQYSAEVGWLAAVCANEVVPAANGDAWLRIGERSVSPQEVCAYVLRHLKKRAEAFAGEAIARATIATPTTMGQLQRRALLEAADLAGLPAVELVDDTLAAATAGGALIGPCQRLLVLDLGAGYFDVALLAHGEGGWQPLACSGDTVLGGDDFDRRIIDLLLMTFGQAQEVDLTQQPATLLQLRALAQRAKHELTAATAAAPIALAVGAGPPVGELTLSHPALARAELDALIQTDLENLCEPCGWAFEDAGLRPDDVDAVLLCGAGARVPAVIDLVTRMVGRPPLIPDADGQLLALGAAQLSQGLAAAAKGTTPHTLSIKGRGGSVVPIIGRTLPYPTQVERTFAKPRADQRSVAFEVYQGDAPMARDNVYVGRFVLEDLAPGPRFVVRFAVDENGTLGVSPADDEGAAQVMVSPSNGLGDAQRVRLREGLAPETSFDMARSSVPPASEQGTAATIALRRSDMPPSSTRIPITCPPPSSEQQDRGDATSPRSRRPRPTRGATLPMVGAAADSTPTPTDGEAPPQAADAPIQVDVDPIVGTTIGDRYLIESLLAEGGMGRVYVAKHAMLGKRLAVKVLHPELATNAELSERFLREAQAAAAIDSDHVVDIIDFGRLDEGTSYFVMEYLEGETLGDRIARLGAAPPELICHVSAQVAAGMGAAHATGIVHRDLKPDNLTLIQRKGNPHFVKILDFGIAKRPTSDADGQLTLVGTTLGTPDYMAPEQIIAGTVDGRTDIYSLGAVMYELATGQPPFEAEALALLLAQHLNDAPKPIRSLPVGATFPPQLDALILKCLAKHPDDRFQSASELEEALTSL